MKKEKVIKTKNIQTKPPLLATATWITILHYWGAPQWLMGVFGAILFIGWIAYFMCLSTEEPTDIFEDKG